MKVLVTGGGGFIGRYVAIALRDCGYEVRNLDLVACDEIGIEDVQGSIINRDTVRKALSGCGIVFHLAGFSNIDLVKDDPVRCIELNVMGTTIVLDESRHAGVERFCLASSVYANDRKGHLYTSSKLVCENICENYHLLYGMNYLILRLGTVYGELSRDADVVAIYARNSVKGKNLIVYGGGKQVRNFIYAGDVGSACAHIAGSDIKNRTLTIAGSRAVSILELANIVAEAVPGTKVNVEEGGGRRDDYTGTLEELEETYKVMGWKPAVDIKHGVEKMIVHHRKH